MPKLPTGQEYNVIYRLHHDAQNQRYTLTVEYFSDEGHAIHRKKHKAIVDQARKWLSGLSHVNPDECEVEFVPRLTSEAQAKKRLQPDRKSTRLNSSH